MLRQHISLIQGNCHVDGVLGSLRRLIEWLWNGACCSTNPELVAADRLLRDVPQKERLMPKFTSSSR